MKTPGSPEGISGDRKFFFARDHELSEIAAFLKNNQSVSLVGPEKIGKTSLMMQLMVRETAALFGIVDKTLFAYVDCRHLVDKSPVEILACFCEELSAAINRCGYDPEPALEIVIDNPTWLNFEMALHQLNQRGLRLVLMLDDFEYTTSNPRLDETFYNALRSGAGRLRLAYLISSRQPLIELTYKNRSKEIVSSPFFNIFAQVYLGLLSEKQAHHLIRNQLHSGHMSTNILLENFIYRLVGGQPYAIQIACACAVDLFGDLPALEQQIKHDLEGYFQNAWNDLNSNERVILGRIARGNDIEVEHPSVRVILRDLTRKCWLIPEGKRYGFPSELLADYVTSRASDPKASTMDNLNLRL